MSKMATSISGTGYGIIKDSLEKSAIETLRQQLTVKPNTIDYVASTGMNDGSFKVFLESSKKIYLPKYYGLKHYGVPKIDKIRSGAPINDAIKFVGSLRPTQQVPVRSFIECAHDPKKRGGILQLPPGWGKTVMALYIFRELATRTLVVVHKDFLLKQWKERIEQYLPMARVGIIKQSRFEVEGCDIVIGSLQTILTRDISQCAFGLVIVDECHHMGAQVFSQALHKMNYTYSLGLSATVTRSDGLSKVFKWFLGDVVFKAKRNKDEQRGVKIIVHEYYDANPAYSFEHQLFNGRPNMSKMLNNICSYMPRTRMVIDYLVSHILSKNADRNVLILSDRRNHLADIAECIETYGYTKETYGYYVGGMKTEALLESEEKQILLGTYNMVSEGFDLPKLDTLVMASPKSNVEQSIGRIQRQLIKERKNPPIVLDIVDDFSVFKHQYRKRHTFYTKSGFDVVSNSRREPDRFQLTGRSQFI
jgi:superfamily II DNA or RNA helicase